VSASSPADSGNPAARDATGGGQRGPVVGFDLDMTLVDSAAGIAATVGTALAEVGLTVRPELIWEYNGVPMEDTMAALVPDGDAAALTARYRRLYPTVGVPLTTLLPGARWAVDAVHRLGGRVVVVSTKVEPAVRLVLAQVGLAVDDVAGGLFARAKAGALRTAGAAVFVGDHPGDVAAARAAAATAVAVATGPHSAEQLRAAGADVVLPDLTGFGTWLTGYLQAETPGNRPNRLPPVTSAVAGQAGREAGTVRPKPPRS
jgi:phosphoglycolate phosphatase